MVDSIILDTIPLWPDWLLIIFQCFKYIVTDPPRPLTEEDIWFQIGHVHEQQKDVSRLIIGSARGHNKCLCFN